MQVLPLYANTHSSSSWCSERTTKLRENARDIIRRAVKASDDDAVIFTGSGSTAAICKLASAVCHRDRSINDVVIFISEMEHHSNMLPWREINGAEIVFITLTGEGGLDLQDLEEKLEEHSEKTLKIGCFCAASNVTGILNDDLEITEILHRHGALAFWDYATAAPYIHIDMNPQEKEQYHKDAIYFSMHKFLGGVQAPGILVAKKKLFNLNRPPACPGGGTVLYVLKDDLQYLTSIEEREEGGTPAIVESIRAGLAMQLKMNIGCQVITKREEELMKAARKRLLKIPNFLLLGNPEARRLPILSFLIKHEESNLFLHHNFVATLLSDLFGIQARGGCACAGVYAQHLLGIPQQLASSYGEILKHSCEILKPGFCRLNLSWFASDEEMEFIFTALDFIARYAWKFLPQYVFQTATGSWQHIISKNRSSEIKSVPRLEHFQGPGSERGDEPKVGSVPSFQQTVKEAELIQESCKDLAGELSLRREKGPCQKENIFRRYEAEKLRWFLLPEEAAICLQGEALSVRKLPLPFHPLQYKNPCFCRK